MRRELLRFTVVGVVATLTHGVVAWCLLRAGGLSAAPSNGIAFAAASAVSYAGNTLWSFSMRPRVRNASRFACVSAAVATLTMGIASAVEAWGGHDALGIAAVIALVPAATFAAHRHYTYRS